MVPGCNGREREREHTGLRCAVASLKPLQNGRGRGSARAQGATSVPIALAKEREREIENYVVPPPGTTDRVKPAFPAGPGIASLKDDRNQIQFSIERANPYYRGANQADVCYYINPQVDMGVYRGGITGLLTDIALQSYKLKCEAMGHLFLGEHEIENYCHHWGQCKV